MSPFEALRQIGLLIDEARWLQNRDGKREPGPREDVLTKVRVSELLRVLDDVDPLDLNDPATENEVANAIVRFHGGAWIPLDRRYPWRLQEPAVPPGRCGAQNPVVQELVCELRATHAGMHEATQYGGPAGEISTGRTAYWFDGSEGFSERLPARS